MEYTSYIRNKLGQIDNTKIVDTAVLYIGDILPIDDSSKRGYEIVDEWIRAVKKKWRIEFRLLSLSKSSFLGNLESKEGGFIINLNRNLFTTQRRFTVAHEIAHLLSYETVSDWPVYEVNHSKAEEDFCDRVARAILLPKTLINFSKFDLAEFDESQLICLKELWPEFKVSPWQMIKKLFDEANYPNLVAIQWEYFPEEDCFRIIERHSPKETFIPKNDRAFIDTMYKRKTTNFAQELALKNGFYSGTDIVEIGSLYKKKLETTAFTIATSHATYIIQLIKY